MASGTTGNPYQDDLDMMIVIESIGSDGNIYQQNITIRELLDTGRVIEFQKWWVKTLYEKLGVSRTRPINEHEVITLLDFLQMSNNYKRYVPPQPPQPPYVNSYEEELRKEIERMKQRQIKPQFKPWYYGDPKDLSA